VTSFNAQRSTFAVIAALHLELGDDAMAQHHQRHLAQGRVDGGASVAVRGADADDGGATVHRSASRAAT
jgi:hypothetical protein